MKIKVKYYRTRTFYKQFGKRLIETAHYEDILPRLDVAAHRIKLQHDVAIFLRNLYE